MYKHKSPEDCIKAGDHLRCVDQNGYCNNCGHQTAGISILGAGAYSVFVLIDDGTWEQPTYRIHHPMSEQEFREVVEARHGGFVTFDVDRADCPEDQIKDLYD